MLGDTRFRRPGPGAAAAAAAAALRDVASQGLLRHCGIQKPFPAPTAGPGDGRIPPFCRRALLAAAPALRPGPHPRRAPPPRRLPPRLPGAATPRPGSGSQTPERPAPGGGEAGRRGPALTAERGAQTAARRQGPPGAGTGKGRWRAGSAPRPKAGAAAGWPPAARAGGGKGGTEGGRTDERMASRVAGFPFPPAALAPHRAAAFLGQPLLRDDGGGEGAL